MVTKIYILLRILIGGVFIVSGFEKLIGPRQNFLYVVEGYRLFGPLLESIIAYVAPWIEFLLGVFLFLGLWTKWVLRALCVLMAGFILVVGQALVRQLPITDCGCFGDLITMPLYVTFLFDIALLVVIVLLMKKEEYTLRRSLDHYFGQ